MSPEELRRIIELPHEFQGIEFKGPEKFAAIIHKREL